MSLYALYNRLRATLNRWRIESVANDMAQVLIASGAPNYLETYLRCRNKSVGDMVLTIQRIDGKTPHQLRMEAEAERDAALRVVDELKKSNEALRDSRDKWRAAVLESRDRKTLSAYMSAVMDEGIEVLTRVNSRALSIRDNTEHPEVQP